MVQYRMWEGPDGQVSGPAGNSALGSLPLSGD